MNLKYLKKEIIPQRQKEIKEGKNAATAQPIYVVLCLYYHYISGHDEEGWLSGELLNNMYKRHEIGYVDVSLNAEDRIFSESDDGMAIPEKVTKIYVDDIKAFFFTRKAAEDYLCYQSHNLNEPYIYTFHSGYRNYEMDMLLQGN